MWVRPGTPASCYIDIHWERFEIAEIFLFQDGNFDFSSIVNDPRNVTCLTFLESGDVITGDDIGIELVIVAFVLNPDCTLSKILFV